MKTIRKIIKRLLITVFSLIILFITLVYIFQDQIIAYFIEEANKELNTTIKYDKIELSLIKNFPRTSILIKNVTLIETPKGSTDTLAHFDKVYLAFNIMDLVRGNYKIQVCDLEKGFVNMNIDSLGIRNFDITKTDTTQSKSKLALDLKKINLENINYTFNDEQNHQNYSTYIPELLASFRKQEHITTIDLSGNPYLYGISLDGDTYFKEKAINLKSKIIIDSNTVLVEPSMLTVENSNFNLTGMIGSGKNDTIHISIEAEEGSKNINTILSILPLKTSARVASLKCDGNIFFNGLIVGKRSKPKINVDFGFENLAFTIPWADKNVSNAKLSGNFNNGNQLCKKTTSLQLSDFSGIIDNEKIAASGKIYNLDDPYIDFALNGKLKLKTILSLFPEANIKDATGELDCDIVARGPLSEFKSNISSSRIVSKGAVKVKNIGFFHKSTNSLYHDIEGSFKLSNQDIEVPDLRGAVGNSDFQLNGKFVRFTNFLLDFNQPLILKASMHSHLIDLDELLSIRDTNAAPTTEYRLVVSPKLDIDFTAYIDKIKFDRARNGHEYKNFRGSFALKNQIIDYQRIEISVAGGKINLRNGKINAQERDHIKVTTKAQLEAVHADSIFYLSRDFNQTFLTHANLKGRVSGNISAQLGYNSKLELLHDKINIDNHLFIDGGELNNFKPLMDLYTLMNDKTDNKVTKLLGLQAYKFFKTDNPNINSFQHLQFKPLFLNEINVRNSVIDITQIALKSNAGDINIYGNQNYGNDSINFYIDVQLKNYHKINKKREQAQKFGDVAEDNSEGIWLPYKIYGTLQNYKYPLDWNRLMRQKGRNIKDQLRLNNDDNGDKEIVVPEFEDGDWIEEDL